MKNTFFNVLNPKKALDIKILSGDKSDNITPIKRGVGVVTAEKILNYEDGVDTFINLQETSLERELIQSNYQRNKRLIDLDFIPQNISKAIIKAYEDAEWAEMDGKAIGKYLMVNKLNDVRSKWSIISKYLKKLT
jgi:5'-3' exonuclease